jgi:hypothetical protein
VSAAGIEPVDLQRVELALCQLSYAGMARLTGLEPATSGLTARCSNLLSYSPLAPATGIEPVTSRLTVGRYCQLSYAGMILQVVAGTGFEPAHLWIMSPAP